MKKKMTYLTEEQKEYIIKNYPTMQNRVISENLGIPQKKIEGYVYNNKIKKDKNYIITRTDSKLSVDQKRFILENYATMSNSEIMGVLNIEFETLKRFAQNNKLTKDDKIFKDHTSLTMTQRKYILENFEHMDNNIISNNLNIPIVKITWFASSNNLIKDKNVRVYHMSKTLTIEQKKYIEDNYSTMNTNDMCKVLNLEYNQIKSYANNLKLKKDFEFLTYKPKIFEMCLKENNSNEYNVNNYINKSIEPKISDDELYKSKYGKYYVNQDYFKKIDNEFKAYWLGFLYADGCNRIKRKNNKTEYVLALTLASVDKTHINKFLNSLQSDSIIRDYDVFLNDKTFKSSNIGICNKQICEDLNILGCTPNKSLSLSFPSKQQLPEEFIRDFIRGYFDGDGSIHINLKKRKVSLSFVGTQDFLLSIQKIINNELGINFMALQQQKGNKSYQFAYGGIYDCSLIYNYLYNDCNIYLDRKLEKFNTLFCLG